MRKHLAPQRPIVLRPAANIQPMRHVFLTQQMGQVFVGVEADIPFGSAQHNFHPPQVAMVEPRQIVDGVVKIYVVVVIAVEERFDIKSPAHAEEVANYLGVLESEIDGVITPKAGAGYRYFAYAGIPAHAMHYFFEYHFIVPNMVSHPLGWVDLFVVPTVRIYAIGAKYLYQPLLNIPARRVDEIEIFALKITPHRRGEKYDGVSLMPMNQHFYIFAQIGGIPLVISLLHDRAVFCWRQKYNVSFTLRAAQ